jgi:hypothetical protein
MVEPGTESTLAEGDMHTSTLESPPIPSPSSTDPNFNLLLGSRIVLESLGEDGGTFGPFYVKRSLIDSKGFVFGARESMSHRLVNWIRRDGNYLRVKSGGTVDMEGSDIGRRANFHVTVADGFVTLKNPFNNLWLTRFKFAWETPEY